MSQKMDAQGKIGGPYGRDDLNTLYFPAKKLKGHRREIFRELHYDLIWEITEMQVKVHVQANFPKQIGPPLCQLALEHELEPDEVPLAGESRSEALEKEIEILRRESQRHDEGDEDDKLGDEIVTRQPPRHHLSGEETSIPDHLGMHGKRPRPPSFNERYDRAQRGPFDHPNRQALPSERARDIMLGAAGLSASQQLSPSPQTAPLNRSRTNGRRRDGM